MTKKKSVEKEIHYKSIINKQKKIIQDLTKKIGRASKLEERYYEIEEQEENEPTPQRLEEETPRCPKCKGQLDVIGGDKIIIFLCQDCGHRGSRKK